jgi:hypothetical protein
MPNTVPENYGDIIVNGKPTHPNDFKVVRQGPPESFSSKLVAERAFPKGATIATLEGLTPGAKRYSTVQISQTEHIELNSDLVFMNHSCNPSTLMDVDRMVVSATRDLAAGDELTFFYPSTEWDMGKLLYSILIYCSSSDLINVLYMIAQPFSCWCGASNVSGL